MDVSNRVIAEVLSEIGEYLEMRGVAFKPRAYEKASEAVSGLSEQVAEIYKSGGLKAIENISGVGVSIGGKIEELLKTGKAKEHEELKKKTPVNLRELRGVEGLGPKSIKKLYENLKIKNLGSLEAAARAGKIRNLAGFGEKAEAKLLKGIEFLKKSGGRMSLGDALPLSRLIEERLRALPGAEKVIVAGSVRRRRETVGDIDILVISKKPKQIMDYFASMPEVTGILAKGETKSSVRLDSGADADLRVVEGFSYGAALNYFTGSKDHNVALRQIAMDKGCKLNEYGLYRGKKQIAGKSEEEIYKALGLDYVEPEMRENLGEIELALRQASLGNTRDRQGKQPGLPKLINYGELKGDLQVQTDWTDGSASIEEMAKAAIKEGLKYIAITDHTKRLAMTGGLDEKRLLKQMAEIDRLNKKFAGKIKILKGSECDILKDGSMDISDEVLAKLDVVGGSVHSYFGLSRKEQTARVIRAMENKNVDIIFHPTGRVVQKREAIDLDMDAIIKTAKKTGTILEIDAYPSRLDLKDDYIKKCVEAGVKMSIDSDAHSPAHFEFLEYGIAQARRGWSEKKDIINAWPVDKMLGFLK
ncbi:MAG: DNA polymerase/3'-5' exonuclease PolX [Candidatus Liptonbacteria bacterium]|nr:DNA polymerase/3'-5' exonuclease PolX [Candidatus Liptonbacteria bacterium]